MVAVSGADWSVWLLASRVAATWSRIAPPFFKLPLISQPVPSLDGEAPATTIGQQLVTREQLKARTLQGENPRNILSEHTGRHSPTKESQGQSQLLEGTQLTKPCPIFSEGVQRSPLTLAGPTHLARSP